MHELAVTVDLVILHRTSPKSYEILLIERKHDPFAGKWALPGGFADGHETLETAAARELEEETGVRGLSLEQLQAFGDPGRDPRGRTVTIAFLAILDTKPAAVAGDDAAKAQWFDLAKLPALAFDHQKIIDFARRRLK